MVLMCMVFGFKIMVHLATGDLLRQTFDDSLNSQNFYPLWHHWTMPTNQRQFNIGTPIFVMSLQKRRPHMLKIVKWLCSNEVLYSISKRNQLYFTTKIQISKNIKPFLFYKIFKFKLLNESTYTTCRWKTLALLLTVFQLFNQPK